MEDIVKSVEKITSYKQLKIWQFGIEAVKEVYALVGTFPKEELYGLTSQMKRAVISIPSNIAEGFKRFHNKEYRQFLFIALGSIAELETQLIIANELSFISKEKLNSISDKLEQISKMISSLMKKLK